ncbi:hypothetical protein [Streptomyces sp. TRM68367]|uniref:hypothetical protein n=1 Tax=Streptomyces sp. TRM68367 TaxID=2758415 RepID=UPI00165C1075|nr:hypothetical protein [Streptomyces sp. TRM68367]MBC9731156.1 hypothetical protein [Streptomyces sp. TRM68367]
MPTETGVRHLGTQQLPLHTLTPYPGNARHGDVPAILASLCRNGQYRSLVVRDEGDGRLVVLAGNHTMQALAAHGPGPCRLTTAEQEQPCAVCHGQEWEPSARCELIRCDEDTARRIVLADNRTAERGGWDTDALVELLSLLDEDYVGTGYDPADVERLIAPPPPIEELADTYRREPQDREYGEAGGGDGPGDAEDEFWPVLKFRVPPEVRDDFYGLTLHCPNPNDDAERFRCLLDRARTADPQP